MLATRQPGGVHCNQWDVKALLLEASKPLKFQNAQRAVDWTMVF